MVYVVYLQGGPEPLGVRTDNRVVTTTEAAPEMRVPCEGGVGLWRYADEHITIGTRSGRGVRVRARWWKKTRRRRAPPHR